jgi:DNA-binding NarL/FixJ family response regulator
MLLSPVKLAIVDEPFIFRRILTTFLSEHANVNILVHASSVQELFDKLEGRVVDIVILDVTLPGINGDNAVISVKEKAPSTKVLALSTITDMELINEMLDAGIHGYISKSDEPEELIQAIRAIAENRIYRNRILTEAFYWNKQNNVSVTGSRKQPVLTDREKRILQLLWEEKSNKEIADQLYLGVRTVERLRQELKDKIGVKSTIGMIKFAVNNKIITGKLFSIQSDFA